MVTFGVDIYRNSETRVSPLDGTLKDFELEGYEGIVKIQDRTRNQAIFDTYWRCYKCQRSQ